MSNVHEYTITLTYSCLAESPDDAIYQMREYMGSGQWDLEYQNESTGERGTVGWEPSVPTWTPTGDMP